MSSSESGPSPPSLEELSARGFSSQLLPWILSMSVDTSSTPPSEIAVFYQQATRSLTVIGGSFDIESLLAGGKEGPPPASKASIDSLPRVEISDPGTECPICLDEYAEEAEVKEMPCKHRFHSDCIVKWLGIHGSCPVCRFSMPVEEDDEKEKEIEETERVGWAIHLVISRGRSRRSSDGDADSDREMVSDPSNQDGNDGNDEQPAQQMDIDSHE